MATIAQIEPAALDAAVVIFEQRIDKAINAQVHQLRARLLAQRPAWLTDAVAAYHTLMVCYNVQQVGYPEVQKWLQQQLCCLESSSETANQIATRHKFPVCYAPEFALDLDSVVAATKLTHEAVIAAHCEPIYHVYTVGFSPGFAYLGDVPKVLQVDRLTSPRARVPAGSVAIAQQQTAIYPRQSPGGWQLIGRVAGWQLTMGLQINAGDQVQFEPVSRADYDRLQREQLERHNDN